MAGVYDPSRWEYEEQAPATRRRSGKTVGFANRNTEEGPPAIHETRPHTTSHKIWPVLCGMLIAAVYMSVSLGLLSPAPSKAPAEEVPPHFKAYVDRVVSRAMRDSVGRRDFALIADGARVIRALTGVASERGFSEDPHLPANSPNVTLVDDLRIGNCWSVAPSNAQLGVRVAEHLYPTHVTVDHIPIEIAADITRAPRSMVLWGAIDGVPNLSKLSNDSYPYDDDFTGLRGRSGPPETANHTFIPLAWFEYDIRSSSHVQTFPVRPRIVELEFYFGVLVLEVMSNWGGETTCLYRVRVHGNALGQTL